MIKLIQCVQNENENVDMISTLKAIKKAGFDGVFIQWYHQNWQLNELEQFKLCKELGLEVEFAHLGYDDLKYMWLEDKKGDELTEQYLKDLEFCKENNINSVVMHFTTKEDVKHPNEVGLERFKKIVLKAQELGIKVSLENKRVIEPLKQALEFINTKNLGICFDSGHLHCHNKDQFDWDYFKNKIFTIHLHDNDGSSDQHKLPFDGSINWEQTLKNLHNAGYKGPITLETIYKNDYLNLSIEDYYKQSYEKANKLKQICLKNNYFM
ncbi:MAG: sugar phosphate isomerase/epimerase [Clostridia bacterium]|nr:sugar phosphate isomerase/epimerase [Clostridia bacterium]